VVRNEYLQCQGAEHHQRRHDMPVDAGNEFRDLAHRRNVSSNIQRICDQQQQHHDAQHNRREDVLDVGRKSLARDASHVCAHGLHGRHQRKRKRHRP